ncbi:S-adenosyl-L-methionine-dependent methyltransferase [Dacryopinax primogenitus]|uniref:S-adenosyl-L-methionine-dependent methyltransferase n=1 Tax=Dacryopinax primogenitus (strain DJM 731) TaxID=1858805 RepID=M5G9A8_DACPD|nr:S-adenosyl-L-methionine-dependent methyltransferase [Dacryopinax primogenitus]EJU04795.1 S-adenosyl-L-methionine-dependent methyltransferase [Dacryopinax primogenitus]
MTQLVTSSPIQPLSRASTRYYTTHTHATSKYLLPADEEEHHRLGRQNDLLRALFDDELLPSDVHLREGDKVLDSGCGPGFWALDLAAAVPINVEIHGFDIEQRMLPSQHPANTIFTVHNMLDLSQSWSHTFAVAHQRLTLSALDWPGWQTTLRNLFRVLKPGGHLIIVDQARASWHLPDDAPVETNISYTHRLEVLVERLFVAKNLLINCGERLPFLIKEAGFEDVEVERRRARFGPEEGEGWRENALGVARGLKGPILKAGGFGLMHSEQEWDNLMAHVDEEWKVHAFECDFVRITARKPEQVGFDFDMKPKRVNEGFP